jgi:hypothetical protein
MAAVAILTTFLVLWGVTTVADGSFIVEFLQETLMRKGLRRWRIDR